MSARYRQYLRSDHWRQLRRRILARDGYTCTDCGSREKLQVHHLCYRPVLEDALDADLATLCQECHKKVHGRRVVRPAKNVIHLGVMAEKRRALLSDIEYQPSGGHWLVRRIFGWLQN